MSLFNLIQHQWKRLIVTSGVSITLVFVNVFIPVAEAKFVQCGESEWSQQALLWLVEKIGYYPLFYFCYEINLGATETISITFDQRDVNEGINHDVMAECDQDCNNINLQVYDQNNQLIGEDLDPNRSFARVRVNNIYEGKEIKVKLTMANCQTDYCGAVLATSPIQ